MTLPARTQIGRHKRPPKQKREGDSEPHLALIRRLPCCVCGHFGATKAHHLLRVTGKSRGMGMKNADKWAIPLCNDPPNGCHRRLHACGNEEAWLTAVGHIDGRALAAALWKRTGDYEAMLRIIERART